MNPRYLLPLLTLKDNGGAAVAFAFARAMVANGEQVTILSSNFHGTRAVNLPENAGIDFFVVPSLMKSRILSLLLFYLFGIFFSLRHKPKLIYTHIATGLIPNFHDRRPTMLAQDIEYRFYDGVRRKIAKLVFARLLDRCDLLVTSARLATYFRRKGYRIAFQGDVGIEKSYLGNQVPSHVTAGPYRPIDCLLIAKRGAHKRHDETVEVARRLAELGRTVLLIDQDPASAKLVQQSNITVLEAVTAPRMRELYADSVVFVSMSRAEGYGLTPLEALTQGCQVVSTLTPSTMYLRHPALEKINGADYLVERIAQAVDLRITAARAASVDSDPIQGLSVPYMEDWARSACAVMKGSAAK